MGADYFMPSEVARLVLGYLQEVSCPRSYKIFRDECADLQEHNRQAARRGMDFTRVNGKSLLDVLDGYIDLLKKTSYTGAKKTMKVMIDHVEGSPCQPKITITPVANEAHAIYACEESSASQSVCKYSQRSHSDRERQRLCSNRDFSPSFEYPRRTACSTQTSKSSGQCQRIGTPDKHAEITPSSFKKLSNLPRTSSQNLPRTSSHNFPSTSSTRRTDDSSGQELENITEARTPFSVPVMSPRTPAEFSSPSSRQGAMDDVNQVEDMYESVFSVPLHSPGTPLSRTPRLVISTPLSAHNDTSQDSLHHTDQDEQHLQDNQEPHESSSHHSNAPSDKDKNHSTTEISQQENPPQTPSKESCNWSHDSGLLRTPRRKRPPKRKGGSVTSSNNNSNESQKMSSNTLEQEVQQLLNSIEFAEKLAENINLVKNKSGESANATGSSEGQNVVNIEENASAETSELTKQSFVMNPPELHNIDTNFPFASRQEDKKLADDALRDIIDLTRNDPEFDALFNIFPPEVPGDQEKTSATGEGTREPSPAKQQPSCSGTTAAESMNRTSQGVSAASVTHEESTATTYVTVQAPSVQWGSPLITQCDSPLTVQSQCGSPLVTQGLCVVSGAPIINENSQTVVSSSCDSDRYPLIHAVALPKGATVIDLPVSVNNNNFGEQLVQVVHPSPTTSQAPVQTVQILSIDPPKKRSSNSSCVRGSSVRPVACSKSPSVSRSRIVPILPVGGDFSSIMASPGNACLLKSPEIDAKLSSLKKSKTAQSKDSVDSPDDAKTTVKRRRRSKVHSNLPKRVTRSSSRVPTDEAMDTKDTSDEGSKKDSKPETPKKNSKQKAVKKATDHETANVQPIAVLDEMPGPSHQPDLPRLAPKPQNANETILLSMPLLLGPAPVVSDSVVRCQTIVLQESTVSSPQLDSVPQTLPVSPTVVRKRGRSKNTANTSANSPDEQPFSTINTRQLNDCMDGTSAVSPRVSPKGKKQKKEKVKCSSKSPKPKSKLSRKKKSLEEKTVNVSISEPCTERDKRKSQIRKESLSSSEKDIVSLCLAQGIAIEQTDSRSNGFCASDQAAASPIQKSCDSEHSSTDTEKVKEMHGVTRHEGQLHSGTSQDNLSEVHHGSGDAIQNQSIVCEDNATHQLDASSTSNTRLKGQQDDLVDASKERPLSEKNFVHPPTTVHCAQTSSGDNDSVNKLPSAPSSATEMNVPTQDTSISCSGPPQLSNEVAQPESLTSTRQTENPKTSDTEQNSLTSNDVGQTSVSGQSIHKEDADVPRSKPDNTETEESTRNDMSGSENVNSGAGKNRVTGTQEQERSVTEEPEAGGCSAADTEQFDGNRKISETENYTVAAMVYTPLYSPISSCSPAPINNDHSRDSQSQSCPRVKKMHRRIRPTFITREISSLPSSPVDYTTELRYKSKQKEKSMKRDKKTEVASSDVQTDDVQNGGCPEKSVGQTPTHDDSLDGEKVNDKESVSAEPSAQNVDVVATEAKEQQSHVPNAVVTSETKEQPSQKIPVTLAPSPAVNSHQGGLTEASSSPWHEGLSAGSPWQFQQPESSQPSADTLHKTQETKPKVAENKKQVAVASSEGYSQQKEKKMVVINGVHLHNETKSAKKVSKNDLPSAKKQRSDDCTKPALFSISSLIQVAAQRLEGNKEHRAPEKKSHKRKLHPASSKNNPQKSRSPASKKQKLESRENGGGKIPSSKQSGKVTSESSSSSQKIQAFPDCDLSDLIAQIHQKLPAGKT